MNLIKHPVSYLSEFFRLEAAAGILLMAAAAIALLVANSPAAPFYFSALSTPIGFPNAQMSLQHWINDGLMALFFLLVGLEIKRELLVGELSSLKKSLLPGIAALGGMVVPAAIYIAFNWTNPSNLRGWAVPAATDIAFALGVISLLGSRVPASLKVFLTALAILDDVGAVFIIALFYTAHLHFIALGFALAGLALLFAMSRLKVQKLTPYLVVGLFLWGAILASGIHATLAGIALAAMIPLKGSKEDSKNSPLHKLEHRLHPLVSYAILPVFGLANAGLSFNGVSLSSFLNPLTLGIIAGLFVGKQVGVFLASWIAVKCGWTQWPEGARLSQIYGVSVLCGIGFTMSLFIGGLAFSDVFTQNEAKLGILIGSLLSAVVGFFILRSSTKPIL